MSDLIACVFSDRDGVLNEGINVDGPSQFKLIAGVKKAAKKVKKAKKLFVVITNQGGLGENLDGSIRWPGHPLTRENLAAIHEEMKTQLGDGAQPDAIKFCPHSKSVGCPCRKPKAGMILEAAKELGIDLSRSYMIGDRLSDIEAGLAAGVTCILVMTGPDSEQAKSEVPAGTKICADFAEAIDWILAQG